MCAAVAVSIVVATSVVAAAAAIAFCSWRDIGRRASRGKGGGDCDGGGGGGVFAAAMSGAVGMAGALVVVALPSVFDVVGAAAVVVAVDVSAPVLSISTQPTEPSAASDARVLASRRGASPLRAAPGARGATI